MGNLIKGRFPLTRGDDDPIKPASLDGKETDGGQPAKNENVFAPYDLPPDITDRRVATRTSMNALLLGINQDRFVFL